MKLLFIILFANFLLIQCQISDNNLLLVISLDGFRYDYIDRYSNPNGFLKNLSRLGVRAAYSESIFPTNTYPNHWTIVTGVYPQYHGILNNDVYESKIDQRFRMSVDDEDAQGWFKNIEPIWITNERVNGIKYNKHSAVFDWPGAPAFFEHNDKMYQATVFRQSKSSNWALETFNNTIDTFIDKIEKNKTNLAFLYIGEPDLTGHLYGPDSIEVSNVVKELDFVLQRLFEKLKTEKSFNIENEIDVLIVTDHGMASILENNEKSEDKHIYLSDYIDVNKYLLIDKCSYGSIAEIWLQDNKDLIYVYEALNKAKDEKIKAIYTRNNIPERFHMNYPDRLAPLILLAKNGYQIIIERNKPEKYSSTKYHGNHGFESSDESMRGIFLAYGKSFKKAYFTEKPVNLIDIYSLMCHLLMLSPNPNNGTLTRIQHILANDGENLHEILVYGGILFIFILIFFSILMPIISILSSVKMTCNSNNDSNLHRVKKEKTKKN